MKSAALIGAGITGLAAAFYLKRKGVPVTIYEAGGRAVRANPAGGFYWVVMTSCFPLISS